MDSIFLLRLLAEANPKNHPVGAVKPNKWTYLVNRSCAEDGVQAFRYSFVKDKLGPVSQQVYSDLGRLAASGLITEDHSVTPRGREFLETAKEFFEANSGLTQIVDQVARKYGAYSRVRLVDFVHSLKVPQDDKMVSIDSVPMGVRLLSPADRPVATHLNIGEDWLETFEILLDPESSADLASAREDIQRGRVRLLPSDG
ncbi:MAG: hypothetical protein KGI98_08750 [Euryarchaeota archaeon]|nr:hypothetical protein [Euryarchaeota archaeon]MDE1882073.1 hypothetical protein [Euryarchaeota archaeon]